MKNNLSFSFSISVAILTSLMVPMLSSAELSQTVQPVATTGSSVITTAAVGSGALSTHEIQDRAEPGMMSISSTTPRRRANLPIPGKSRPMMAASIMSSAALPEPVVAGRSISGLPSQGFLGFNGISHYDQRVAGGNTQFSDEPPDQAVCAANGFVVEAVNNAVRVFSTTGAPLVGVDTLNHFFKLAPEIDRTTGIAGPFLSDPKCLYDRDVQRWFLTQLMQDTGNNPGANGRSYTLIAVSQTNNPLPAWTIFRLDATDDGLAGTPSNPGCPCFGDQPLIGTDKYAFHVTTNEFGGGFNGAQVYAISKTALANAAVGQPALLYAVHINAGPALTPFGGLSYSIQPALQPALDFSEDSQVEFEGNGAGVEYYLSALQFGNPGFEVYDNRIAAWALTNTRSLNAPKPAVTLQFAVIRSEVYGQPDAATQKAGPIPLGAAVGERLEQIQTNDDRMNQVVLARGTIFGAVNTKLKTGNADHTGIAWFAVRPQWDDNKLKASVIDQGYVAVAKDDLYFPSIAVTSGGQGAMVFTISGPDLYPSLAYVTLSDASFRQSPVFIAGLGQGPEDGFSGYVAFGGNGSARWGDYSAAFSDGNDVWFAGEYIPRECTTLTVPCRTALANWGTFVGRVRSNGDNEQNGEN